MTRRPPPRPDVLALLRACKERPLDHAPRLVLADWLEENGNAAEQALSEVFRLGCARAADYEGGPPRWGATAREIELTARYGPAWLGRLAGMGTWQVDRGLFEVYLLAALVDVDLPAPALAEGWHWVQQFTVRGIRGHADALAAAPLLGGVGWLDLSGEPLSIHVVRRLSASSSVGGLTGLVLRGCDIGPVGLRELLKSPHWGELGHLDLTGNELDTPALTDLLSWPGVRKLYSLQVGGNHLGGSGLQTLAGSPALSRLESLDVSETHCAFEEVAELFRSPHLTALRQLNVWRSFGWGTRDTGSAALALLDAAFLDGLEGVRFPRLHEPDEFLQRLARCPRVAGLRALFLSETRIGPETALALLASPHLSRLRFLQLTFQGYPELTQALRERFPGVST